MKARLNKIAFNTHAIHITMKKIYLSLIGLMATVQISLAQWTAPASGILSTTNSVGIGTTAPTASLHLYTTGWYPLINIQSTSSTGESQIAFTSTGSAYYTGVGGASENTWGVQNSWYVFDATNNFMRLVIKPTGYVGIGTTTPQNNLQIGTQTNSSTSTPVTLSLGATYSSSAGTNPKLKIYDDGTNRYGFGVSNSQMDAMVPSGSRFAWYIGGSQKMSVSSSGNVLIGKTTQVNTGYVLDVGGSARMNSVVVNTTGADFVFDPKYRLPALAEVGQFIQKNHHLPQIPSAKDMQVNGLDVGGVEIKLLQKVEELTLYLMEEHNKNVELEDRIKTLEATLKKNR